MNPSNYKTVSKGLSLRMRRRESESVYGVAVDSESPLEDPTFQLSIWGFAISWTMCPILFYLHPSIPHSPWAIKYCAMWQNVCAETKPNGYSIPTGSQSRIMFCHSIHSISLKFYEAFRCCCCCTLVSCVHQQYPIHSASTICAHYSTSNEVIEFHGKQSTKWNGF